MEEQGKPKLVRLALEWRNHDHDRMRDLKARLLQLKAEKNYEDVWHDLAVRNLERHVRNLEYVAYLLYLIDERRIPIVWLQMTVGLDQGHLYRTMDRAGVDFQAVTSDAIQVEEHLFPWSSEVRVIDPRRELVVVSGKTYHFSEADCPVLTWLDEEEKTLRLSAKDEKTANVLVPIPIYPAR